MTALIIDGDVITRETFRIRVYKDGRLLGFLSPKGINRLKVHAVEFRDHDRAEAQATQLRADNPGHAFSVTQVQP